jgi:hypothetical protein
MSSTPSAASTEVADPFPSVPESVLRDHAAAQTIANHPALFKIITPIDVDRFQFLLSSHPNRPLVESVCRSLREGVWPFAVVDESAPITFDFSEQDVSPAGLDFLREQRDVEISCGRYSPAFGTDLLPGMYSTPVGVVPKPHSDKFRLINDLSAGPHAPNFWIARDDSTVRFDNLQDFGTILRNVHKSHKRPPAWLFKDDVSGAYRRWPVHPFWQIKQIITIDGQRHVDRCMEFGTRSAARVWCTFMGLVVWIAIHVKHIPHLLHYMDDAWSYDMDPVLVPYKPYAASYPRKQVQLLALWDEIALPHEKSKQLFGKSLRIIGLDVDPYVLTISFPPDSKLELVAAIRAFVDPTGSRRRTLVQWQRLIGWINWALNVFPLLRPALQSSYAKIAGKSISKATIYLNQAVVSDLSWLADTIASADGLCLLNAVAWRPAEADLTVYCDASLEGMGFYVPSLNSAFYSPISSRQPLFHIFFFEALCVVSALVFALGMRPAPHRLLIYSDSMNTVDMFHSLKAHDAYNHLLLFAIRLLLPQTTSLRVFHIPGADNAIADAISRGLFHVASSLHPALRICPFKPPQDAMGAVA